jgi:hypothetical protein
MASKDFLDECINSIKSDKKPSQEEFEEIWCKRCMRTECKRSQGMADGWVHRMRRQKEAVENPDFGEPSQFETAHNQAFISYDGPPERDDEQFGGWKSWSEEGAELHREEPPSKKKETQKLDRTIEQLTKKEGPDSEEKDRGEEDHDETVEEVREEVNEEFNEEFNEEGKHEEERAQTVEAKDEDSDKVKKGDLPDQDGKTLSPDDVDEKTSNNDQKGRSDRGKSTTPDKWSVQEGDGDVTVNISSGEKVDE